MSEDATPWSGHGRHWKRPQIRKRTVKTGSRDKDAVVSRSEETASVNDDNVEDTASEDQDAVASSQEPLPVLKKTRRGRAVRAPARFRNSSPTVNNRLIEEGSCEVRINKNRKEITREPRARSGAGAS